MPQRPTLGFDPIAEAQRQWDHHGWGEQTAAMGVVTSIMRLQQVFLSKADAILKPLGLTFARYEVLMLLRFSSRGSLPLGKIGERLQVNAASVTNAVNRLEADDLVARRPNPDDGRGTFAALTSAGRERAEEATSVMNRDLFSDLGMTEAQLNAAFESLRVLRRAVGDFN